MPLNIFDGSNWNPFQKIQVHDGSSWNESKGSFIWDGSAWNLFSTGAPNNTVEPVFSQSVIGGGVEQTLSITTGTWDNNPTSYRYVWEVAPYSNSGFSWQTLIYNGSAQTSSSAYIPDTYVGYLVRCKVYALNQAGESQPVIIQPGIVFGPQQLPELAAYIILDGKILVQWRKAKGATGYYMQYQGAQVAFTELDVSATNQEPGTSPGSDYVNKYLELPNVGGSISIFVQGFSTSNPFSTALNSKISGGGRNASTNIRFTMPTPSLSLTQNYLVGTTSSTAVISVTNHSSFNANASVQVSASSGTASFSSGNISISNPPDGRSITVYVTYTYLGDSVSNNYQYNSPVYTGPVTTYGPCEAWYTGPAGPAQYTECNGTAICNVAFRPVSNRRLIYSDGSSTGTYDYNCADTQVKVYQDCNNINGLCGYSCICNYSDVGGYYFSPQSCEFGTQRTGALSGYTSGPNCPNVPYTAICTSYDANNSASANYYQCIAQGDCSAQNNISGRTRCTNPV
jgi:hypothetical protein